MRLPALLRLACSLVLPAVTLAAAEADPVVRRLQAHTAFLADDLLEGRGTGTRGHALAAHYVASQFARLGLEPGADGGYAQPMKFIETTGSLEGGRMVIRHGDKEDTVAPVTDMLAFVTAGETSGRVTAPAVFIGFGVQAPELGYDDYAGVDLRGKIAVILSGAPKHFPSTQRAHYSDGGTKRRLAVEHGAIGVISVFTPADEARYGWPFVIAQSRFPGMRLLDADGRVVDVYPELRVSATLRRGAADRIFAASGRTADEVFAKAERGEAQSFPLGVEVTLAGESTLRTVESLNVLGWLPGSDPTLARQPVVVTGHLDHLGVGAPVDGDSIYNGAVDNALGIAMIIEAAERLAAGPRPARPVLFAALTAEEKGLLGARHLARNPPARVERFAANLNIDMSMFPLPVRDLLPWGAEHSTLGALAAATAARKGFTVSPDPMPEETIFVRSDQYPFVQAGVPALFLASGPKPLDPAVEGIDHWTSFLRERYHKPSDEMDQPLDWPSAGAFTDLATEIIRDTANAPAAPAWLPGDFFGKLYGPKE